MKTIGEKLKELREKSSFSQSQIAGYLGKDQSFISLIEKNERNVSIDILQQLATLYGISMSDYDKENIDINPIQFSMRCNELNSNDLKQIAEINEIANASKEMAIAIEDRKWQTD